MEVRPNQGHAPQPSPRPQQTEGSLQDLYQSRKKRSRIKWVIGVILLIALVLAGMFAASKFTGMNAGSIDQSKYQALFLSNGQVYFGKLSEHDDQYVLKNIYYLQAATSGDDSQNPQDTTKEGTDAKLIKLGSEVHGPEDVMVVMKDQVLFYENLKPSGSVSNSIKQYESK